MSKKAKKITAIIFTILGALCIFYGFGSLFYFKDDLLYRCFLFFSSGIGLIIAAIIFWIQYSKAIPDEPINKNKIKPRVSRSYGKTKEPFISDEEWEELEEEEEDAEIVAEILHDD